MWLALLGRTRAARSVISSIFFLQSRAALAVERMTAPTNPTPQETAPRTLTDFFSSKTPYEFWLTCIILIAGLLFAYLTTTFIRQTSQQKLEVATRAMTIIFIIIATMILITAGYSNEQIAPAFGLLGTIVGYILGRGERPSQSSPVADIDEAQGGGSGPPDSRDSNPSDNSRLPKSENGLPQGRSEPPLPKEPALQVRPSHSKRE